MANVTDMEVESVPGWFSRVDRAVFRQLLSSQIVPVGDLAELGVFKGKSAVLIGAYLRPGEQFTVVDLFDDAGVDSLNRREKDREYPGLSRSTFERNYLRIHHDLPKVVQGNSSLITEFAQRGSHRFVHVDASHLYAHVNRDISDACHLLAPNGVVVIDDFRHEHTPGVAAASWGARSTGLRPFLLTPHKMYATWGDSRAWFTETLDWLTRSGEFLNEVQEIGEETVARTWERETLVRWLPPSAVPYLRRARRWSQSVRGGAHLPARQ